jgi:hypothetical protein
MFRSTTPHEAPLTEQDETDMRRDGIFVKNKIGTFSTERHPGMAAAPSRDGGCVTLLMACMPCVQWL